MSNQKVRIKDIAERAGLSVGTVDRVIHGRTNVSKASYEIVKKVLAEMNYEPNYVASALASNKTYNFCALMPMHEKDSYWARVEKGLYKGVEYYKDFKIDFKIFEYDPFNDNTFREQCNKLMESKPFAVIIAPILNGGIMKDFVTQLKEKGIPFGLLDSNWPEFEPLCFYGQNSIKSGEFSARVLLMSVGGQPKELCIFKVMGEGRIATRQQLDREVGFKNYVKAHCPDCEIKELQLFAYDKKGMQQSMQDFFTENKNIECGITFNSTISIIAEFLNKNMPDYNIRLLGYDTVGKNVECLKKGTVDFIVAQHAKRQGYNCFRNMFSSSVLHAEQERDHYVAIELLMKENVDFYED